LFSNNRPALTHALVVVVVVVVVVAGWFETPPCTAITPVIPGVSSLLTTGASPVQLQQMLARIQEQAKTAATLDWFCRIYIGSLEPDINEKGIEEAFGRFGPLRNVVVNRVCSAHTTHIHCIRACHAVSDHCHLPPATCHQHPNGQSKGYAFVHYANPESANAAIQTMNGATIGNGTR
jgi:hypothetical protein